MPGVQHLTIRASDGETLLHACLQGPADAPVITLLHTLATHAALFDDDAARLASRWRVLRLDMRGHGQSQPGPTGHGYSLSCLAADVLAAWDQLAIPRSHLLGLSIGGMIALEVALAAPSRVASVVAADCRADAPPPFLALWPARRALLADSGLDAVADLTLPTWLTPAAPAEAVASARAMILATSPAGYIAATHALEGVAITPRLPALKPPALFLAGSNDGLFPAAARAMAEAVPSSRLAILQGPAHLPNLEAPEAFHAAIQPFFASHDEVVA
jgi:3-oxoadipate enol-lactonase